MITDERLKEMRDGLKGYETWNGEVFRELKACVVDLLDEIDRLKASIADLGPDGMTALTRHIEQGVVITVLRTGAGDTVTTFKRVKAC